MDDCLNKTLCYTVHDNKTDHDVSSFSDIEETERFIRRKYTKSYAEKYICIVAQYK